MAKQKCENCDETPKCLLEVWIPQQKRWGEEWVLKKVCPTCWEVIVSLGDNEEEEEDDKIYTLKKEQRAYICSSCCNYKECPSGCPLLDNKESYELDGLDKEDICSHCKFLIKGCDESCPIRKVEECPKQS